MQNTTRKQLQGYGLSQYLAIAVTKNIKPVKKDKNTNYYTLPEVIASIKVYLERKKIKQETCSQLKNLLNILEESQDNLIYVPFVKGSDEELSQLAKEAYLALRKTTKIISNLKAEVASLNIRKDER